MREPPSPTPSVVLPPRVEALRDAIEEVSHRVVALLNERARLVEALMEEKRRAGLPLSDPWREQLLVARLAARSDGPLDEERIRAVFRPLFDQAIGQEIGQAIGQAVTDE